MDIIEGNSRVYSRISGCSSIQSHLSGKINQIIMIYSSGMFNIQNSWIDSKFNKFVIDIARLLYNESIEMKLTVAYWTDDGVLVRMDLSNYTLTTRTLNYLKRRRVVVGNSIDFFTFHAFDHGCFVIKYYFFIAY